MKKVYMVLMFVVIVCFCFAEIPQNTPVKTISPNGKYYAESYGTDTSVTAAGLYPYEGIRVVDKSSNKVLWKMTPGYYVVKFNWSPNSRYVAVYYEARTYGESIIVDIKTQKVISLPSLDQVALYYGKSVLPEENRPDPYFLISKWIENEGVVVNFRWTYLKNNEPEVFKGQFEYNIFSKSIRFKK